MQASCGDHLAKSLDQSIREFQRTACLWIFLLLHATDLIASRIPLKVLSQLLLLWIDRSINGLI